VTEVSPRSDTAFYVFGKAYPGYRRGWLTRPFALSQEQTFSFSFPPKAGICRLCAYNGDGGTFITTGTELPCLNGVLCRDKSYLNGALCPDKS
jgi:hypothetical protein